MNRKLWVLCVAALLVLGGLLSVSNFQFEASGLILGILAVAGGVLLLLDR